MILVAAFSGRNEPTRPYPPLSPKSRYDDDWEPALEAFFRVAGASLLAPDSRDAAVVVTVPAGRSRSLAVRSADGSAGEVLLEIYELP